MFNVLVDTCVWLDLAKDPRQAPVIGVIEEMLKQRIITLLVPRVVLDEFRRNRQRIETESAKSLTSHVRVVKEAVGKIGGDKRRMRAVLAHLDDVGHKAPIVGGSAVQMLDQIERLLKAAPKCDVNDGVKLRAAQRALDKRAPFHHGRNSMADALIIEAYAESVGANSAGARFAFVTHNKHDFSATNHKLPHPDIAGCFSRIKSLYFTNLVELLRRIAPGLVTEVMFELSYSQDPRGLIEILEAEDLLMHQVWYNRHWGRRIRIEEGRTTLVEKETYPKPPGAPDTIQRNIWEGALKAQESVERRYGLDNLGPWDDFEWGMINGKLSALRWVLGDEWDMLDT